jgi:hypothetical protein
LMKHFRSGGKATDPMRNFLDLWRPLPQTRYQCWGYESGVVLTAPPRLCCLALPILKRQLRIRWSPTGEVQRCLKTNWKDATPWNWPGYKAMMMGFIKYFTKTKSRYDDLPVEVCIKGKVTFSVKCSNLYSLPYNMYSFSQNLTSVF